MSNPLILKLEQGAALSDVERGVVNRLTTNSRVVSAGRDLISEGEDPTCVRLVMEGFACRYKRLPDGRRQIMALLVPGDFCDLRISMLSQMDHSIGALTNCRIVEISTEAIAQAMANHPGIEKACAWATLVDEAILREWLVSMGQRSADRQMAHLFCELLLRLQVVGLATETSYSLSLTQEELGDVLGLSGVHVNRTLRELRERGLVAHKGGKLTLLKLAEIHDFCGFNPTYLHHRKTSAPVGDGALTGRMKIV